MNKGILIALAIVSGLLLVNLVSAVCLNCPTVTCPNELTVVKGRVYDQSNNQSIGNADVEVICHGESGDASKSTKTGPLGNYWVIFSPSECDLGDSVTVNAEKDGMTGTMPGAIDKEIDKCCLDLNVGIVNVPLIPEFGVIIGTLTLASAIVVFFVIRKK